MKKDIVETQRWETKQSKAKQSKGIKGRAKTKG